MQVEHKYVFCYWLWPWTLLFLFGIIKQTPLPSLLMAVIYNIWTNFFSPWNHKFPLSYSILVISMESLVFLSVAYKSKNIVKDFFKDMYFNIFVFLVYLAFLSINNMSFSEIYFKHIPNQRKLDGDALSFIKNKFAFVLS